MNQNDLNVTLNGIIASGLAAATLSMSSPLVAQNAPTRGENIDSVAGHCRIGQFPQTQKVGYYNSLCEIMQDGEKCYAFLKGHVQSSGAIEPVNSEAIEKARYCLDVLRRDLGLED